MSIQPKKKRKKGKGKKETTNLSKSKKVLLNFTVPKFDMKCAAAGGAPDGAP